MSPLPAIPLEVERYIGACLISNHNHQKFKQNNQSENTFYNRERYYPQHRTLTSSLFPNRGGNEDNFRNQRCNNPVDRWAGGMPLISFVNQNRNRRPEQQRPTSSNFEDYNLARLAVHTQGAPLILTKTYNNRKNKIQRNQNNNKYHDNSFVKTKNGKCEINNNNNNANFTADTVSVTSDESYGSGNSDRCLPRIIKPRKRRKKDRKLPIIDQVTNSTDSSESASPEVVVNPTRFLNFHSGIQCTKEYDYFKPKENRVTGTFNIINGESETPRLHHSFDEVEDVDDTRNLSTTTSQCQCRYCDPSGQIWDVDKTSYSSFLTPPDRTNVFTYPEFKSDLCLIHELSRMHINESEISDKGAGNCDNVEHRASTSDLEVSTEIVTSLNGLRDLEIKFFSTTSADSNSSRTCNNKVFAKNSIDIETC